MEILIIEDEKKVANAIKKGLKEEHFKVDVAYTGEDGFFLVNSKEFDLIILDIMLPGRDGIEILKTLRANRVKTPVLLLTAKDTVEDRVSGLDSGADDYLIKPFAFSELLARIRALLRRGRQEFLLKLKADDLEMDLVTRKVTRRAKEIELTVKEFEILEYLLRNKNQIVTKNMLHKEIWEYSDTGMTITNVVEVYINLLRRKIDDGFKKKLINTVRGAGYTIRE